MPTVLHADRVAFYLDQMTFNLAKEATRLTHTNRTIPRRGPKTLRTRITTPPLPVLSIVWPSGPMA